MIPRRRRSRRQINPNSSGKTPIGKRSKRAELLDIYLEPFQKFTSKDELLSAYQVSKPVASIVKALAWHTTISRLERELHKEYAWIVPELMREFLYRANRLMDWSNPLAE